MLRAASVERDTRDSIVVTFAIPDGSRDRLRFAAGQYLTLRATIAGEDVRRPYSICSPESSATVSVAIKRVAGGVFSTWAHETLEAGTMLAVAQPQGTFVRPRDARDGSSYVGFVGGSGITPLMSIVATTLACEPTSRFTLVYGNRATSSVMFREALQRLKDRYLRRLALVFVMSREPQEIELFSGRIDRARCDALFERWIDIEDTHTAYVCGPGTMADDVTAALVARGMPAERVRRERFTSSRTLSESRIARPTIAAAANDIHATAKIDGRERAFTIARGTESVLEAALRAGIDLPYSCKSGVCATCRAMLVSGEVDMDVNFALEDYEVRRGFVLTCQSYPASDAIAIDVDRAASL